MWHLLGFSQTKIYTEIYIHFFYLKEEAYIYIYIYIYILYKKNVEQLNQYKREKNLKEKTISSTKSD
jgi:hypothetical protein